MTHFPIHLVWKVGLYTYCLSSRAYCLNAFFSRLHNVQFLQSSYAQIYSQMPVKWISIFSAFSWIYVFNVANIITTQTYIITTQKMNTRKHTEIKKKNKSYMINHAVNIKSRTHKCKKYVRWRCWKMKLFKNLFFWASKNQIILVWWEKMYFLF